MAQPPENFSTAPSIPERLVRRIRRDGPLLVIDLSIVFVAYLSALVLRFEGAVPDGYWTRFWLVAPLAALIHLGSNYAWGLYGRMWQYASVHEAQRMAASGVTSATLVILISLLGGRLRLLPLSVIALGTIVSLAGFAAIRFQSRLFALRRRSEIKERDRLLIVGAGEAAAKVLKDLTVHHVLGLEPIALVDDNPRKLGLKLHGIAVVGTSAAIPRLVEELEIDEVLLAIPSATSDQIRDIASLCEQANVPLRVLPSVRETVTGKVTARDIRDLRIEDLLGRQQVETDLASIRAMLAGRRVLVTGAGGSIGSEISRQVAAFAPSNLLLLDNDETHLHDVSTDLPEATMLLADIRDRVRVEALFESYLPEIVFHAAAHKHVPILESHPQEAFMTNVFGTANVAEAAVECGVKRFVLISTDKAVQPRSVMGASKKLAEQIVWSLMGGQCTFCAVRFGNVLGSRGSVIPTFFKQIQRGGPVTVTDPQMTRYFMSVQEAVQLVLQAAALAERGEVFTLDMGEPVKILGLAERVIRLSGRVPNKDVKIEITGVRPGEKLDEELREAHETAVRTAHPSILMSRPIGRNRAQIQALTEKLFELAQDDDLTELAKTMMSFEWLDDPVHPMPHPEESEDRETLWSRSST